MQNNLLAFNAAIEAPPGGDAGFLAKASGQLNQRAKQLNDDWLVFERK